MPDKGKGKAKMQRNPTRAATDSPTRPSSFEYIPLEVRRRAVTPEHLGENYALSERNSKTTEQPSTSGLCTVKDSLTVPPHQQPSTSKQLYSPTQNTLVPGVEEWRLHKLNLDRLGYSPSEVSIESLRFFNRRCCCQKGSIVVIVIVILFCTVLIILSVCLWPKGI